MHPSLDKAEENHNLVQNYYLPTIEKTTVDIFSYLVINVYCTSLTKII